MLSMLKPRVRGVYYKLLLACRSASLCSRYLYLSTSRGDRASPEDDDDTADDDAAPLPLLPARPAPVGRGVEACLSRRCESSGRLPLEVVGASGTFSRA